MGKFLASHAGGIGGALVGLALALFVTACQPKTKGIDPNGTRVDVNGLQAQVGNAQAEMDRRAAAIGGIRERQAAELAALASKQRGELSGASADYARDVAQLNSNIEAAAADLKRQDDARRAILTFASSAVQSILSGNPLSPWAVVGGAVSLAGAIGAAGSVTDNMRKTKIVAQLAAANAAQAQAPASETAAAGDAGTAMRVAAA